MDKEVGNYQVGVEKKTNRVFYILKTTEAYRTIILDYRDWDKCAMKSVPLASIV